MRNGTFGLLVVFLSGVAGLAGCGASAKSGAPSSPSVSASGGGRHAEASPADHASGGAFDAPAGYPAPPPAPASEAAAPASVAPSSPSPAPSPVTPVAPRRVLPEAGQLTAGVWDDNLNFDFFKPYAVRFTEQGADFTMFTQAELETAQREATARATPHTDLDVQLVLDTTGSMGDELSYLQSELDAIAGQLKTRFPNVTPRWSLVVYRDHGDAYVTRAFDFTSDTRRFRENLRAQSAGGGGDTPEAVVEGLGKGLEQQWRPSANVAKLAFWLADAPAHPGEGKKLGSVIRQARQRGVHIYPIASSDTDDTAEYQMRSAAQMTGGRYVFLTNDSGVGNSHAEPHIPCYNVTRLDRAIVRMISVELSGRYVEADGSEVVRAVGRPNKEGKCQLSSGALVASY
jgi:von Willebrand factor type A domain